MKVDHRTKYGFGTSRQVINTVKLLKLLNDEETNFAMGSGLSAKCTWTRKVKKIHLKN